MVDSSPQRVRVTRQKVHSTVLSRDAVAKTFPSGAHAPSQMIRVCDLSTARGTYPTKLSVRVLLLWIQVTGVLTGLFLVEQVPSSVTRNCQDIPVVRTERDACHGEGVAFQWLPEWPECLRIVHPNRGMLQSRGLTCRCEQLARRGDADGNRLQKSSN